MPRALGLDKAGRPCLIRRVSPQPSGFRVPRWLHGVRNNRDRLRRRVEYGERILGRLPYELEDCSDHAQNARRVYRRFHHAPAFLFRASQDPI